MLAVLRRELMAATTKSRGERMWVGTINTWPISPWGAALKTSKVSSC